MPHIHYKEMMQYAEDAAIHDRPWELWECIGIITDDLWTPCTHHPKWNDSLKYRRKTKTININGFEVPEPVRLKPNNGDEFFHVNFIGNPYFSIWRDTKSDNKLFCLGLVHLTMDNARIHANALASFTKKEL